MPEIPKTQQEFNFEEISNLKKDINAFINNKKYEQKEEVLPICIIPLIPIMFPAIVTTEIYNHYSKIMYHTPGTTSSIVAGLLWPVSLPVLSLDICYNLVTLKFFKEYKKYKNKMQKLELEENKKYEHHKSLVDKFTIIKNIHDDYIKHNSQLKSCINCSNNNTTELMFQLVKDQYECKDCNLFSIDSFKH